MAMSLQANVLQAMTLATLLLAAAEARSQGSAPAGPLPPITQGGSNTNTRRPQLPSFPDDMPTHGRTEDASRRARDEERQKRLVSDTDKLLALATQLKQDVEKTDRHMLSLDLIRRSEEIEKLAKSIKDRARE